MASAELKTSKEQEKYTLSFIEPTLPFGKANYKPPLDYDSLSSWNTVKPERFANCLKKSKTKWQYPNEKFANVIFH